MNYDLPGRSKTRGTGDRGLSRRSRRARRARWDRTGAGPATLARSWPRRSRAGPQVGCVGAPANWSCGRMASANYRPKRRRLLLLLVVRPRPACTEVLAPRDRVLPAIALAHHGCPGTLVAHPPLPRRCRSGRALRGRNTFELTNCCTWAVSTSSGGNVGGAPKLVPQCDLLAQLGVGIPSGGWPTAGLYSAVKRCALLFGQQTGRGPLLRARGETAGPGTRAPARVFQVRVSAGAHGEARRGGSAARRERAQRFTAEYSPAVARPPAAIPTPNCASKSHCGTSFGAPPTFPRTRSRLPRCSSWSTQTCFARATPDRFDIFEGAVNGREKGTRASVVREGDCWKDSVARREHLECRQGGP